MKKKKKNVENSYSVFFLSVCVSSLWNKFGLSMLRWRVIILMFSYDIYKNRSHLINDQRIVIQYLTWNSTLKNFIDREKSLLN